MQVYFGDNPELDKNIQVDFGDNPVRVKEYRYTLATTWDGLKHTCKLRDGTKNWSNHAGILRQQPGMGQGMGQSIHVNFGDNPG